MWSSWSEDARPRFGQTRWRSEAQYHLERASRTAPPGVAPEHIRRQGLAVSLGPGFGPSLRRDARVRLSREVLANRRAWSRFVLLSDLREKDTRVRGERALGITFADAAVGGGDGNHIPPPGPPLSIKKETETVALPAAPRSPRAGWHFHPTEDIAVANFPAEPHKLDIVFVPARRRRRRASRPDHGSLGPGYGPSGADAAPPARPTTPP